MNDKPDNDFSDDDDSLDWLKDSDSSGDQPKTGDATGLTGQLNWETLSDDLPDSGASNDDFTFDWQSSGDDDDKAASRQESTGVTGKLDWQAAGIQDASEDESDDDDWDTSSDEIVDDDAEEFADFEEEEIEEEPASLQGLLGQFSDDDETDIAEEGDAEEPDWLSADFDEDEEEGDAEEPDWLSADFDEDEEEDTFVEEPITDASGLPDWLSVDLSDATESDDEEFAAEEEPEAVAGDVPDWLSGGFDDDEEEEAEAEPVAEAGDDWLSDMGFGDDEDAESNVFSDEPEPEAVAGDVPDWLSGGFDDDEEEEAEAEPVAEAGDDWLSDMGFGDDDEDTFEPLEEADDVPDWLETAADDADFGFEFGDEADDEFEVATGVDTDYLRSMGIGEQGNANDLDWFTEETTSSDVGEPDWLSELGDLEEADLSTEDAIAAGLEVEPEPVEETPVDTLSELDALLESFETSGDSADELEDLGDLLSELEGLEIETEDGQESIGLTGMLGDYAESEETPSRPKAGSLTGMLDEWQLDDELQEAQPDSPEDIAALLDQLDAEDEEEFDLDEIDLNDIPEEEEEEIKAAPNFQELLESSTIENMPLSEDAPEWLRQLQEESGEDDGISAAALVRDRDDKPLEDLPDRLLDLRERGLNLSTEKAVDPAAKQKIANVVPDADKTLAPAELETDESGLAGSINLTPEQAKRAALLRDVVGAAPSMATVSPSVLEEADTIVGNIDLDDLEAIPEEESTPAPAARPRRRQRRKLQVDRVLIALLLIVMIAAPFVLPAARFGDLPSAQIPAGSPLLTAYEQVEMIETGDLVLVAVEYGLAGTGELDGATDVLIRHIIINGGRPVVVSSNPVGLLHSAEIMTEIAGTNLTRNKDYYILQYIPAGAVGLRDLAQNLTALVTTDYQSRPTGLTVDSFDEFELVIVIAEQAESVRLWAEQIAPLTDAPIITAMSYAAVPLSQPYIESQGVSGMLIGYRDAYSYSQLLKDNLGIVPEAQIIPEVTEEPTATSTPLPTDTPEPEGTEDIEVIPADGDAVSTEVPSATPTEAASTTLEPPTPTEAPTEAESIEPTNTPVPTATPTEEVKELATFAVIISRGPVNLRSGPGTDFAVVTTANPGESFQVLDTSDDGTWYEVALPNGNTAWIADFLVQLEEREVSASDIGKTDILKAMQPRSYLRPASQVEDEPEVTPEVTPSVDVTNLAAGTIADDPIRWYAITMGTIGAAVVILLGNVANIVRHLTRKEED